ncbi:TraX family protein [Enterobacter sp.]|uniref:TraX family protein n=1 Tax=Enterobacter sp. TaxID=42895 RepID=UPI00296FD985|nr:TraX family protein [Enterobacter sp.]
MQLFPNLCIRQKPGTLISPAAIDAVKATAFLAMLLDHFNTLFLSPPELELYAIGRMAFPLFILMWALNACHRPENLQKNANRQWVWAFITQPVFALTFSGPHPWYALNILFVFAAATQLLALHHRYGRKGLAAGVVLCGIMTYPLSPASYGLQGLVLALSAAVWFSSSGTGTRRVAAVTGAVALVTMNGITHLTGSPGPALLFAVLPTVILPFVAISCAGLILRGHHRRFLPGRCFYYAYTGHLLFFLILRSV